jgi:hypothetical protein
MANLAQSGFGRFEQKVVQLMYELFSNKKFEK